MEQDRVDKYQMIEHDIQQEDASKDDMIQLIADLDDEDNDYHPDDNNNADCKAVKDNNAAMVNIVSPVPSQAFRP